MSEMIELGLLHEEHFRKNPISGTVVQHLSIDAEMDQRLASEHGAERLRNTLSSPDFQTNICGEEIFLKLLAAFREDHAVLGRGFNELSCCLRAADILGAARAARRIYEEAGPHICFEEEDFYPALVPLLGEQTVRKMRQEHCCGFDAVRTLLNRRPDLPLPADLSKRLLAQSEVMEAHIAECGELFAALHHIASADQQVLYDKLMKWRQQQPKLDLDRRTVGCGALRLVQCHPAALPLDASRRSSLPIAEQLIVQIGADERRELARLASRLIADEPALVANDTLDPRTGSGIADGPALFFEDQSAIALHRSAPLDYRSRLLAGDGDVVAIGRRRHPEFEAYCRDLLGLGDPAIVVPAGPLHTSLARRCADDPDLMAQLCGLARRAGRFGLVPFLGSESAWGLASAIATQSGEPVWVAAPGPRLSRRVNDKLWFSERVTEVLGRRALPQTHRVYGPEALARRIALAGPKPQVRLHQGARRRRRCRQPHHRSKTGDRDAVAVALAIPAAELARAGVARSLPTAGRRLGVAARRQPIGSAVDSPSHHRGADRRGDVRADRRRGSLRRGRVQHVTGSLATAHRRGGRIHRLPVPGTGLLRTLQPRCGASRLRGPTLDRVQRPLGRGIYPDDLDQPARRRLAKPVVRDRASLRIAAPARSFAEVVAQLRERLFRTGGPAKGIVFARPPTPSRRDRASIFSCMGDTKDEVLAQAKEITAFLS